MSVNRAWWDERAGLHGQDRVYDTAGFLAGRSRLRQLEAEVAGDVRGQDVVHLQCHTGMDTLSWLRVGAGTVTGIDFSDVAVEKARQIAAAAGYADRASFVQADAVAVPVGLQDRFDVCVATYGVLEWIGDVATWMRSAAGLLRRGGRLVVVDFHPLLQMVETVDPLRLCFPYANDGPRRFGGQTGSYAVPDAPRGPTMSSSTRTRSGRSSPRLPLPACGWNTSASTSMPRSTRMVCSPRGRTAATGADRW